MSGGVIDSLFPGLLGCRIGAYVGAISPALSLNCSNAVCSSTEPLQNFKGSSPVDGVWESRVFGKSPAGACSMSGDRRGNDVDLDA